MEVDSSYLWSMKAGTGPGPRKMDLKAVFPLYHPYPGLDLLWPLGPCTGKVSEADGMLTPTETVPVTGWRIS